MIRTYRQKHSIWATESKTRCKVWNFTVFRVKMGVKIPTVADTIVSIYGRYYGCGGRTRICIIPSFSNFQLGFIAFSVRFLRLFAPFSLIYFWHKEKNKGKLLNSTPHKLSSIFHDTHRIVTILLRCILPPDRGMLLTSFQSR